MSYTAIDGLKTSIINQIEELTSGKHGIDDTVRIYEVLKELELTLELTGMLTVNDRVGGGIGRGVATPTIIKGTKPKRINIWKGME